VALQDHAVTLDLAGRSQLTENELAEVLGVAVQLFPDFLVVIPDGGAALRKDLRAGHLEALSAQL